MGRCSDDNEASGSLARYIDLRLAFFDIQDCELTGLQGGNGAVLHSELNSKEK